MSGDTRWRDEAEMSRWQTFGLALVVMFGAFVAAAVLVLGPWVVRDLHEELNPSQARTVVIVDGGKVLGPFPIQEVER